MSYKRGLGTNNREIAHNGKGGDADKSQRNQQDAAMLSGCGNDLHMTCLVAENDFRGLNALGVSQAQEIGAATNPFKDNDLGQGGVSG